VAADEAPGLRTRHLARFRHLAIDAGPSLYGPEMARCLDHLDAELDNLRAALDWAIDTDPAAYVEIVSSIGMFWRYRSIGTEGMDLLQQAIDLARVLPEPAPDARAARCELRARLLATAAIVGAGTNRRTESVRGWADEAVEVADASGDRWVLGLALSRRPRWWR